MVCKILSFFFCKRCSQVRHDKELKIRTWHSGLPSCGFIDIILRIAEYPGPPRSVALTISTAIQVYLCPRLAMLKRFLMCNSECLYLLFCFRGLKEFAATVLEMFSNGCQFTIYTTYGSGVFHIDRVQGTSVLKIHLFKDFKSIQI